MYLLHVTSLLLIAVTWLMAWRVGCRCCRGGDVDERASGWALGTILPTAALVFSAHLTALASLIAGRGLVAPEPVALIFLLATGLAHLYVAKMHPPLTGSTAPAPTRGRLPKLGFLWWPVLVVAGLYTVFLVDAVTRYPTGYDGLHYHLPMAVTWMQSGSIDLVIGQMHRSLPDNAMLVPMLMAFGGFDRLFTLINVPNALLLAAGVYGLTRALGVGRTGGVAAGCVALSLPIVVFQSFSSYIDLYALVAWLLSLLALTRAGRAADRRRRRDFLLLAGLSAGVALGGKTTFLILVPLLGLVAIAVEWIRRRETPEDSIRPVRNALLFGCAALVCSGFWFVRGSVQAGNPIYPLGITIGGKEILPGSVAGDFFPRRSLAGKVQHWSPYPWTEESYSGTGELYSVNNGLGAAYATFVPLGLLAAVLAAFSRRPRDPTDKWKLTLVALTLTGPVLLLTVFHEVPRYVLPQLVLAVPVAALLFARLIARFPRSASFLLTLALVVTAAIASVSPARAFFGRVRDGTWSRTAFYEIPELIDGFEPGTRILNFAQPPLTYPLVGRNLTNDVISGPHWAALLDGRTDFARALRDHEVDYIYVREPWPKNWPSDLPLDLIHDDTETRLLITTPATRIYRVSIDE